MCMMRPPLSAHYRPVNFVDKQYEALMSSPEPHEPRPAATRVSDDDIPTYEWLRPKGKLETRCGWGIDLCVTSNLGSVSGLRRQGNLVSCTVQKALRRHALIPRLSTISISDNPTLLCALARSHRRRRLDYCCSLLHLWHSYQHLLSAS